MKILTGIFLLFLLNSCSSQNTKYKEQYDTCRKLFGYIDKYDTVSIRNIVGINPEEIGSSYSKLFSTAAIIREYLIPNGKFENYKIKYQEYPENSYRLVDIIINLEKQTNGVPFKVKVEFVKYIEKGKILDFNMDVPIDIEGAPIPQKTH